MNYMYIYIKYISYTYTYIHINIYMINLWTAVVSSLESQSAQLR